MSKDVESLVRWYREKRREFGSKTYFDRSTWLKERLLPYVDWDNSAILEKEISFNVNVLAELQRRVGGLSGSEFKSSIPMILLALRNRAEYISNQSDAYPLFVGFMSFLYAFLGRYAAPALQVFIGLCLLVAIFHMIETRFKTRREILHCKELINILELYEKKTHTKNT